MVPTRRRARLRPSLLFALLGLPLALLAASRAEGSPRPTFTTINSLESAKALGDTVRLFGGPGEAAGKFQQSPVFPWGPPDRQGWIGVDRTEIGQPVVDRAGDFSKVLFLLQDLDPCRSNDSPQMTFVDDGTAPNNAPFLFTGGSVSPVWNYGPGGHVVNYTDGVSTTGLALHDEVWSPPIVWNTGQPGDTAGIGVLEFDVWSHLPRRNGILWTWGYRTFADGAWSEWYPGPDRDDCTVCPECCAFRLARWEGPAYRRLSVLLPAADPESLQVSLGVVDVASTLGLPGIDATPAPWFDDVFVYKIDAGGPVVSTAARDLFQDAFPRDGTRVSAVDFDTPTNLLTREIPGLFRRTSEPGDSIPMMITTGSEGSCRLARVASRIPRATLVAVMKIQCTPAHPGWPPPCHDAITVSPPTVLDILGPDLVRFTVLADTMIETSPWDGFRADLPEAPASPVFRPGSVAHFYLECEDCEGRVSRVPNDLTALTDFSAFNAWDPRFVVRALPSPEGRVPGVPPSILLWIDGENEAAPQLDLQPGPWSEGSSYLLWRHTLGEIGLHEKLDYDVYVSRSPDAGFRNGLGSAGLFGATPDQLQDYRLIIYSGDRRRVAPLSDGSAVPPNDAGNDLALLQAWLQLPGERYVLAFGDNFVEGMHDGGPAAQAFLFATLGVEWVADDWKPAVENRSSVVVRPVAMDWLTEYSVVGSFCPTRDFDHVRPLPPAPEPSIEANVATHVVLDSDGHSYAPPVAGSVLFDRSVDGARKATLVFPYALASILEVSDGASCAGGRTARACLLDETLAFFGIVAGGTVVGAPMPTAASLAVHPPHPNPLNPRTTVSFDAPRRGPVAVSIFDLRGRRIATVFEGVVEAGRNEVAWHGADAEGRAVASGVYVCVVEGFGEVRRAKLAVVR